MFLKWTDESGYVQAGETIPALSIRTNWASPPRSVTSDMSGAGVIVQYLEAFKYRTDSVRSITDSEVSKLYEKALELDEELVDTPCDVPTLKSLMDACVSLKFVLNCGYKFFNAVDAFKYYTADYGCCVVQTKFTTTTSNAHDFKISKVGTVVSPDVTKGFVAFGYDENGVILQNSLGPKCGSLGFNRMSWAVFQKVFVSAASFTVL